MSPTTPSPKQTRTTTASDRDENDEAHRDEHHRHDELATQRAVWLNRREQPQQDDEQHAAMPPVDWRSR